MGYISIKKLNPHPKNEHYFTNLSGEKYEEVKNSIITHGIREPIVVTTAYTIISGHQRFTVANEIGLEEVPVEIRDVNEWEAEYMLIAYNTERRGEAESDSVRKGRIAHFLKEYWEIKNNGDQTAGLIGQRSMKDVADAIGESERTTRRLIALNKLIEPYQKLVSNNKLGIFAAEQLSTLSVEEQDELYKLIGDSVGNMTIEEIKVLRKEVEKLRRENENLKGENENLKNMPAQIVEIEVVPGHVKEEITRLEKQINELKQKNNLVTEESKHELNQLNSKLAHAKEVEAKYKESQATIIQQSEQLSHFMDHSTNFQLIKNASATIKVMKDFLSDMNQLDYLSDTFNEIPDATRREYVRSIYGVYKWAYNILNTVRTDDVLEVNRNIISYDALSKNKKIKNMGEIN